ncbi:MAG: YeeE/YedE family protein [Proteobacteria bacterium]|nr:YeeE/YedE family protein [Pseudomonadota bacterium]
MDITSWAYGLLGGLMIGTAAAIFLLVNGKVMGASGILGGLIDGSGRDTWRDRILFLAGLVGAPALLGLVYKLPATNVTNNIGLLIVAGLLVGVGTRLGSGCTSGHGVCGISRLSVRSIISTFVYIGAGAAVIVIARSLGVLS